MESVNTVGSRAGVPTDEPLRVMHVITNLDAHGAQHALARLLAHTPPTLGGEVVSLEDRGPVADAVEASGWPVVALGMGGPAGVPAGIVRLARRMRRVRPDVVQTWMYHADLVGGLAARAAGIRSVVWGIRQSDLRPGANPRSTIWAARSSARLSRVVPAAIVCGSEAAKAVHTALGYDPARMVVIPNGYDVGADERAAGDLRADLGIPADAVVIGRVGRYHPQKDHPTFLRAVTEVLRRAPDVHVVLCGDGVTAANDELAALVAATGAPERVHLLGPRDDVPRVHRTLDVACSSSSYGEGFPNVVAEAMAAGVPVVTTDVGDSALIVGETGTVVPPADPAALAEALLRMVADGPGRRAALGAAARDRVGTEFGISRMVDAFADLYREVAGVRH